MTSSDTAPIKILIVDDAAGVRELLKDALKLAGYVECSRRSSGRHKRINSWGR